MPKLPLPALIGTGAVGSIGIGTALNSREKKKAAQRVAQFNQEEVKDWNRFTDNTARKSFIQQLGKDPMTDPKLLQYAENMNRLKTGSKVTEIPGDGGSSYQITKLRGSDRFGCTCNDWRYKKSVAQPGEELDCKHIKQYRQMSKTAAEHGERELFSKEAAELISPLKPHQERVLKKLESSDGVIVAHRVGAGKTLTSIAAAVKSGKPIEVVTPASLTPNFEKELKKHVRGEVDARIRSYEKVTKETKDGRGVDPQRFLILDEAHRLRNSGTDTASAIRPVAAKAHKRLLLTGTAIYNQPADIAPLANIAAGSTVLPQDEAAFNARFIRETEVKPGLLDRLRGVRPGIKKNLQNESELENALRGRIDLHEEASVEDFPIQIDERVYVPMSDKQKEVYDTLMDAAPLHVRLKIKSGLPPSKQEAKNLNAFVTGARQASSSPRPYSTRMTDEDEARNTPKIQEAVRRLAQMRATDDRFRGVVYSNYIDAGLRPYEKALQRQKIPFETLTGSLSAKQKAQLVSNYNSGKTPVLLVSSSGTEGLDLKGTKLVQVLEPHWNNSKIDQVIGRGVRYQSHSHLPPEERKVVVQQFYSSLPKQGLKRLFNMDPGKSTEEWIQDRADEKTQLAAQMREVFMRASGNEKSAGHVEDRIAERAPGAEAEVNTLRSKLRQMKLRKGQTYHVPLSRGKGYAVIGDIGDRHAVKTVLGPSMQPPGERLKVARAPRDYKREYEQYHAKPEQVENRSLRNQARKKLGLSKGDPREVDHKTPLSRGGGNGHANLRAVSRSANREKFNKIAESSDTTSVVAPLIAGSVVGGGLLSEVPQQLVGNAARSVIKSNSPLSKAEVSALSKQYNIPIEQGEKSFATSKGMTLGKNSASLQTFHHELGHLRDPGRVDRRNLEPGSVRHTLATLRNEGVANIRAVGTGGLRQIPHAISSQTTYLMGAAKRHKKGLAGIALGSGALGTGSLMLRRTKKDEVRK
jgi:superfamily II DNA or RNA helicase